MNFIASVFCSLVLAEILLYLNLEAAVARILQLWCFRFGMVIELFVAGMLVNHRVKFPVSTSGVWFLRFLDFFLIRVCTHICNNF